MAGLKISTWFGYINNGVYKALEKRTIGTPLISKWTGLGALIII